MSTTTRQRKAERDLERKRQQQIMLLVGIVVMAVLVLLVVILSTQAPTQAPAIGADGESAYTSLTLGTSPEGMPQLGSSTAPMTIYDYSSFGCSHCMSFHDNQFQQLKADIEAGDVRFVYVPVSNQFSLAASGAAFCAEEQGRFWEMHDILFGYLAQYANTAFVESRLYDAARTLGLDEGEFRTCLSSSRTQSRIDAANQLFYTLADQYENVTGTPTLTYNGVPPSYGSRAASYEDIRKMIDQVTGS